jgi:hypothetical protein
LTTAGELSERRVPDAKSHASNLCCEDPEKGAEYLNRPNTALRTALADPKLRKTFTDGGMDLYPDEEETPEAAPCPAPA